MMIATSSKWRTWIGGAVRLLAGANLIFSAFVEGASAQNIAERANDVLERSGAAFGCAARGPSPEMMTTNAFVWPDGTGAWRALVAHAGVSASASPKAPCWGSPGRCAVFFGSLPDFSADCAQGLPGLGLLVGAHVRLQAVIDAAAYGSSTIRGAERLLELASRLEPEDTMVTLDPAAHVYLSRHPDDALRARYVIASRAIRIERIRTTPNNIQARDLERFATRLSSNDLASAGPLGAIAANGVAVINDRCFRVAAANVTASRLRAAETVFQLSAPLDSATDASIADDVTALALGADGSQGPTLTVALDQDPRIFLAADGKDIPCPG